MLGYAHERLRGCGMAADWKDRAPSQHCPKMTDFSPVDSLPWEVTLPSGGCSDPPDLASRERKREPESRPESVASCTRLTRGPSDELVLEHSCRLERS